MDEESSRFCHGGGGRDGGRPEEWRRKRRGRGKGCELACSRQFVVVAERSRCNSDRESCVKQRCVVPHDGADDDDGTANAELSEGSGGESAVADRGDDEAHDDDDDDDDDDNGSEGGPEDRIARGDGSGEAVRLRSADVDGTRSDDDDDDNDEGAACSRLELTAVAERGATLGRVWYSMSVWRCPCGLLHVAFWVMGQQIHAARTGRRKKGRLVGEKGSGERRMRGEERGGRSADGGEEGASRVPPPIAVGRRQRRCHARGRERPLIVGDRMRRRRVLTTKGRQGWGSRRTRGEDGWEQRRRGGIRSKSSSPRDAVRAVGRQRVPSFDEVVE